MRIGNELKLTAAAIVCALATGCGGGDATEAPTAQLKQAPQAAQVDDTAPQDAAPPAAYARQTVDLTGRPSWDRGEESCDECVRGAGVMQPATPQG